MKVYQVYHGTESDKELLGEFKTKEDAMSIVVESIYNSKFRSYYQRFWYEPDGTMIIDYGSHTKFYFVKEA